MSIKHVKSFRKNESLFLINLRNQKYVRFNSINSKTIPQKKHELWFKKFLKNKNNKLFLIKYYKKNVGYIRIEKKKEEYHTSWAILKKYSGKGITSRNLKKATNKKIKYVAKIKRDNKASIQIAKKSGFKFFSKNKNLIYIK